MVVEHPNIAETFPPSHLDCRGANERAKKSLPLQTLRFPSPHTCDLRGVPTVDISWDALCSSKEGSCCSLIEIATAAFSFLAFQNEMSITINS